LACQSRNFEDQASILHENRQRDLSYRLSPAYISTMPPRIQLRPLIPSQILISPSTSVPSFLVPFLHNYTQSRNASILANLSDTPGSYSRKIRRGRGPSSGKGKTSGRGHKGQKQHGKVPVGMQGGQTADHVVHGKEGFNNIAYVKIATNPPPACRVLTNALATPSKCPP